VDYNYHQFGSTGSCAGGIWTLTGMKSLTLTLLEDVMSSKNEIKRVAMKISGGGLPSDFSVTLNTDFDFTGCTREELVEWSVANRKVAAQRWLRYKTPEFLEELARNGFRVHARVAGTSQQSREDQIRELEALGIGRKTAEMLVDNPQKLDELVEK